MKDDYIVVVYLYKMFRTLNFQTPLRGIGQPVADPGFPVGGGGRRAIGGALTSDVDAFPRKHMRKRKNWILLGGRAPAAPPPGSANGNVGNYLPLESQRHKSYLVTHLWSEGLDIAMLLQ